MQGRVSEQRRQRLGGARRAISLLRNTAPEAELLDPPAVVELVMSVRHREVRNAGLDPLRECADAAVIHERCSVRQGVAERHITESLHSRRQLLRQLLWEIRHQHAARAQPA